MPWYSLQILLRRRGRTSAVTSVGSTRVRWVGSASLLLLACCAPTLLIAGDGEAHSGLSGRDPAQASMDTPPTTAFGRAQALKRAQREAVLATCRRDLDLARRKGLAELEKVLVWAAANDLAAEARDLFDTLRKSYPEHPWPDSLAAALRQPASAPVRSSAPAAITTTAVDQATEPAADPARRRLLADFQRRRDNALQAYGSYLMGPARACFSVRMFDRTYDILLEILRVAPDDRNARNYLGYAPVINPATRRREWVLVTDAEHLNRREVWLDDIGWVPQAQLDRVKKGEFCENGRWTSLADANRRHADPASPWVLDSPHFSLRTTLDRAAAVRLSVALEAYYRMVYKDFLGFFAPDGGALNLLFDTRAAARPLVVNYFATQAQYEDFIRKQFPDPARAKLLLASQGFYSTQLGESVFYPGSASDQSLRIAFHETTHQILGEYCRDRRGHLFAWQTEMPAVYMERVQFDRGQITVPVWAVGARHRAYWLDGKPMRCADFTRLTNESFHADNEEIRVRHYAVAGGFADFLMNADGGIYRQSYMEFLRACYRDEKPAPLDEFLGLSPAVLENRWSTYQRETFTGASKGLRRVARPRPNELPAAPFFAPSFALVPTLIPAATAAAVEPETPEPPAAIAD